MTTKSQSYKRSIREGRESWRESVTPYCMLCGTGMQWPGLQIHEMLAKSGAPNNWAWNWNYILLCEHPCHSGRIPFMTHAQQLAVKWERDNRHFNLEAFLRTRNPNAMDYVTMGEVWIEAFRFRNGDLIRLIDERRKA